MTSAASAGDVSDPRPDEVRALEAELASRPSATETLTRWCADHHLAADPRIVAVKRPGVGKPPDPATLALLGGAVPGEVRYRGVELTCGGRVLSEADNWYRPDRLTPEMNETLRSTETPFGVVARPLKFTRRTVEDFATPFVHGKPAPAVVLRHRAVLSTEVGLPFSVVVERYTAAILDVVD